MLVVIVSIPLTHVPCKYGFDYPSLVCTPLMCAVDPLNYTVTYREKSSWGQLSYAYLWPPVTNNQNWVFSVFTLCNWRSGCHCWPFTVGLQVPCSLLVCSCTQNVALLVPACTPFQLSCNVWPQLNLILIRLYSSLQNDPGYTPEMQSPL